MENGRRVVITGLGPISPNGMGARAFREAIFAGKSGIARIEAFDVAEYSSRIGGEVRDFSVADFVPTKEARKMDRFSHFAVAASRLALEDAGYHVNRSNAERLGVYVGSGIGGLGSLEEQHRILLNEGPRKVSPYLIPRMISNLAGGHVSISVGAKGPNLCTVTACASGAHAIGEAFEALCQGLADAVLAGGSEAAITPLGLAGFCALRSLSTRNDEPERASRPFDLDRDGFVIAEGAGVILMETLESALRRGAHIYCEVKGYGLSADAYHIVQPAPEGEGAARAMQAALARAGLGAEEVDYINAHGTSTALNDELETRAIKTVFGEHARRLLISSTKSMTGHLLGAAGGIEAVACALAISQGEVPPTINLDKPDPACDLDYVPNRSLRRKIGIALSNSLAFGGQNAVLAFGAVE